MTASRAFPVRFLAQLAGFLVWSGHFALIYGLNALYCERGPREPLALGLGWGPLAVLAATALALCATLAVGALAAARRWPGVTGEADATLAGFWRDVTIGIAALAGLSILWNGLPALIVPACS